jgi:fructose-bisphosphate aldolase/6-deoxy-5-ketofructose 1-phosphate synthase
VRRAKTMSRITGEDICIPADVPREVEQRYIDNYLAITRRTGNLMLFAGDQKVEHLNDDFYGEGIHQDDGDPEHLFRIASRAEIGVFATQLGLIARYGRDYSTVPYLVKLNSKTNLIKTTQMDPFSQQWYGMDQVIEFANDSGLRVLGVGCTIYLGSEWEHEMLYQAAQMVYEAHREGLISVLWMYPRGKAVKHERDPHLIAGATGVAACLGTDFVKVNYPEQEGCESKEIFKEAIKAAGRTKVVCAGGSAIGVPAFLQQLHDQISVSGAAGSATGRNIHQKPLDEAVRMCNAISAITLRGLSVEDALAIFKGRKELVV